MRRRGDGPVAIVGAGVAGLSCALHLRERGRPVCMLEASDGVGGRVRTDVVDGFRLDRGFQVLLTAYPEVQRLLDLEALRLGSFFPGALVRLGDRFERVADPFRRPLEGVRTLASPIGTLADKLRMARVRRRVCATSLDEILRRCSRPSRDALRELGFSDRIVERFFRPFFGGVFLDPELATSSRLLAFAFRMFATGDATLPAEGMGAIPAQLARRLPPDSLRLRTRVVALDGRGVRLASGARLDASAVVVATEAGAAGRLLPELEVPPSNAVRCLYFDAPEAPGTGTALVLNGSGEGPIHNLCVPSAIAAEYAPPGRHLVSASVLSRPDRGDRELEAEVRTQLEAWFGPGARSWRHLRTYSIGDALPRQTPGPFEPAERATRLAEGLFVCGDHRDTASLNGAMASGRRAACDVAEAVAA